MEKRNYNRIPVSIKTQYLECQIGLFKNLYAGTIKDVSERGMFLKTKYELPRNSLIEICIPIVKKKIFGIPIKKKYLCIPANLISTVWEKTPSNGSFTGIGIELSNPPQEYLEFVSSLKSA